jgi:hypothetical protein
MYVLRHRVHRKETQLIPPVLVVVFNRPDCTMRLMGQLAQAKPPRLYIAADGPRSEAEKALCDKVRQIATTISWECEVKTLFREENVGCKLGVSGAIDWFFQNEDKGIILEDDCIPSLSFFPFCGELLDKYENDERIGAIAGSSFLKSGSIPESYYCSRYSTSWGWATWARAWRNFDIEMKAWPRLRQTGFLASIGGGSPGFETFWSDIFDQCYADKIPAWDYQWLFSFWRHGYSACVPAMNLVENIGYQGDGTNQLSYSKVYHGNSACELTFPLAHPTGVERRTDLEAAVDNALAIRRRALHIIVKKYVPLGASIWTGASYCYRKIRSS